MEHLRVGHYTDDLAKTGISVFLFNKPAVGSYIICGSAPASRELAVLDLGATVETYHGLVFSGGSAFGLGAADGAMQWLKEQKIGFATAWGAIPLVPAASIFDIGVGQALAPSAEQAYLACQQAYANNNETGSIGAGCGASVGKLIAEARAMQGGFGHAQINLENGVCVEAYTVVNCLGDVQDNGSIIAGAVLANGDFANSADYLLRGKIGVTSLANTTLVAVFTNAQFAKPALHRMAKVAISGMARAISPVFMRFDGDILFCTSLGDLIADELVVSTMAAEAVRLAIINAVQASKII